MAKIVFLVMAVVATVVAEPPVNQYLPPGLQTEANFPPTNQYLPPSSQYGAPGAGGAPSSQYGAPGGFGGRPSSQYGAPSGSNSGFGGKPSSQYGAPGAGFGSAPSSQYGAPGGGFGSAPSSQYGAPGGGFGTAPSSQYGAPGGGRPSSQYGAPSSQYGAPSGFGQNGGYNEGPSEPANYEFKYDVDAPEYGTKFGHQESRQGDVAQGKYYVLLPDGRTQVVEYVADQDGYRPKISYEGGGNGAFGGNGNGYGRGPQSGGNNGGYRYRK